MAFPNLSDLAATTIEYRSKDIADNVTSHNAALVAMKKAGGVSTFDGGTFINENLSFAENGNGGSYSGYDTLPTATSDVITAAQYSFSQYAVPVTFSGRETLTNSGKEALIDLVEARVKVAESTMSNLLNRHFYLDGTGNNGKNITGLAAAIPLSNATGTYGGINRATYNMWRNQKFQASIDGAGVATTGSELISQWNQFILSMTRGTDRPKIILASPAVYALYESGLQSMQRISDATLGNAGFQTLQFQGIPVVFDTNASGIGANTAYFLNTDFMKWRSHKDRNMVALDDKTAVNQDSTVKTLVWAGNLTMSGPQFCGVYSNT
jgi:hypothetical protein